jgi:hypothetical protein
MREQRSVARSKVALPFSKGLAAARAETEPPPGPLHPDLSILAAEVPGTGVSILRSLAQLARENP